MKIYNSNYFSVVLVYMKITAAVLILFIVTGCNTETNIGYSCDSYGCVVDVNGLYDNEAQCFENCEHQFTNFNCLSGDCVGSENGIYESIDQCLSFCGPTIVSNSGNGVSDIDGNSYPTIVLGNGQEWMAKNLNVTKYRNGDEIPFVMAASQWENLVNSGGTGGYCELGASSIYGKLYNWYAVMDERGLCPTGWHVPQFNEWNQLIMHLDPNAQGAGNVVGGKIKVVGTDYWNTPNTGASNASGFSGLPSGERSVYGNFSDLGTTGSWWSSTQTGIANAARVYARHNAVNLGNTNTFKGGGFAVRCVRD